jgi:AraC family transcriptional regulator
MLQNGTVPASDSKLQSASHLGNVAEQLFEAAGRVLEGDRESAQARVARAMALLHRGPAAPLRIEDLAEAGVSRATVARGGLAPWQVRRVTQYIEENLASTIRLQDLAHIARLSHSHFCRAFKESIGHPAHAYVMRRRVQRAQGLMLNTVDSLSQIAAQCGMADQAHFCKLFRRLVGESPNAWRRANRQSELAPA